MFLRYK